MGQKYQQTMSMHVWAYGVLPQARFSYPKREVLAHEISMVLGVVVIVYSFFYIIL